MLAEACSKWSSKSMLAVLCRLVLSSTVYHIWQARDAIKFQGRILTEEQILRRIYWEVRSRISGKGKFTISRVNVSLCHVWNIAESVLFRFLVSLLFSFLCFDAEQFFELCCF